MLFACGCSSPRDSGIPPEASPSPAGKADPDDFGITQDDELSPPASTSSPPAAVPSAPDSDPASSPAADEEASGSPCYVTGDGVRMREAPSIQAGILMLLYNGAEIKLIEDGEDWSMVSYDNTVGYIRNDLFSATNPAASDASGDKAALKDEETASADEEVSVEYNGDIASPKIIIKKSERILELWDGSRLHSSYPIGLGWEPEGDKKKEGDGRTPEGTYYVCTRNGSSRFYLSLGVSYPNKEDAREALDADTIDRRTYEQIAYAIDNGVQPPWNTAMGGEIMIHGYGSGSDWTAGCIAVDNDVMDILWEHCPMGTAIIINP